jgi:hypothetical protein
MKPRKSTKGTNGLTKNFVLLCFFVASAYGRKVSLPKRGELLELSTCVEAAKIIVEIHRETRSSIRGDALGLYGTIELFRIGGTNDRRKRLI